MGNLVSCKPCGVLCEVNIRAVTFVQMVKW